MLRRQTEQPRFRWLNPLPLLPCLCADRFPVEDQARELVLVTGRLGTFGELRRILLVGVDSEFEVGPVKEDLADGLLGDLTVVAVAVERFVFGCVVEG